MKFTKPRSDFRLILLAAGLNLFLLTIGSPISLKAAIIEVGDLNFIDDLGNPSDGLPFLDTSYSDGLTLAGALANAQATYPTARLATPAEWDDLFAAASIDYVGAETISTAFDTGGSDNVLSSPIVAGDPDVSTLIAALGASGTNGLLVVWSDPDGSSDTSTTRDYISMFTSGTFANNVGRANFTFVPPSDLRAWFLVLDPVAVPEPSSLAVAILGLVSLGLFGWRRRKR